MPGSRWLSADFTPVQIKLMSIKTQQDRVPNTFELKKKGNGERIAYITIGLKKILIDAYLANITIIYKQQIDIQ